MGNLTPVLFNFDRTVLEYSPDNGVTWIGVPYFTSIAMSGGGVDTTDVAFVDVETAQVVGQPGGHSFAISVGSLAPTHRAVVELNAALAAGTKYSWRITLPTEGAVFTGAAAAMAEIAADTGEVTLTGDKPNIANIGRGHVLLIVGDTAGTSPNLTQNVRTISHFGTGTAPNIQIQGGIDDMVVYPAPPTGSPVSAGRYKIVRPQVRRGPFVAALDGGIRNFNGAAGGQLTTEFTLTPEITPPDWAAIVEVYTTP